MVRLSRSVVCALIAALSVQGLTAEAHAKNNGVGHGNKFKFSNSGKIIPPGQIKRYTRGAKLPSDLVYVDILDLSKWKLLPPGAGYRYIKVDNEILKVTRDLSIVVEAVGIVSNLLR